MRYQDATAFRQALEQRLNTRAQGQGARISRLRKRVAFDRLLARLLAVAPGQWLLKGGFALDVRLADRARSTKDIDIDWQADEERLEDALIDAAAHEAGDFFVFAIERVAIAADRLGGSHRFNVTASLAARPFEKFLLDVGIRSADGSASEMLSTEDLLGFAGIAPVKLAAIALELQLAEKLHAYTRTYEGDRVGTRVKDLVDIALIATSFQVDAEALLKAIRSTFASRDTHEPPERLPEPPEEWAVPFRRLAVEVGLSGELASGQAAATALFAPLLTGQVTSGQWNHELRRWTGS